MISDPDYIKRDLATWLDEIQDVLSQWVTEDSDLDGTDFEEAPYEEEPSLHGALLEIERFVFWSAFAVRKLIEGEKLSDELEAEPIAVRLFPRIANERPEDLLSSHRLERFYELQHSVKRTLTPKRLCDQLVHSYQFLPVTDETARELTGLLFNSDRSRRQGIFYIDWNEFDRFIRAVVSDGIAYLSVDRRTGRVIKRRDAPGDAL